MRKTLTLLVVLMFVVAFTANAQDEDGKFGVKAGVNLANWAGSDADDVFSGVDKKMLLGFAFGAYYAHPFSENFSIQPELLFTMKGVKFEEGDAFVKFKTNYIEIPVLFKYAFPSEGQLKPYLFAGPAIGILMSANQEYDDGEGDEGDEDIKDEFKSTDIGLAFGVGFTADKLTVDARFTMGMTDIPDYDEDISIKNSNISIMVGYGF